MKKKGVRLVLLLAAVIAVLALFLILNRKNKEEAEKQAALKDEETYVEDGELLYSFDYDTMEQIAFTYEGSRYSFTRKDGIWIYDDDPEFPIHQVYMETKAQKLAEIYVDREIEGTKSSMEDFGLDEPVVSVSLSLEDGKNYTFLMGKRNDTVGAYYMYDEAAGKYYLMDGSLIVAFGDGFSLYDLAELEEIPSVSDSEITHIYVNGEENKNMDNLSKIASLKFDAAVNYKASETDMESYGLSTPAASIKVEYNKTLNALAYEQSYTLLIGKEAEDGKRYACLEGSNQVSTLATSDLSFIFE